MIRLLVIVQLQIKDTSSSSVCIRAFERKLTFCEQLIVFYDPVIPLLGINLMKAYFSVPGDCLRFL